MQLPCSARQLFNSEKLSRVAWEGKFQLNVQIVSIAFGNKFPSVSVCVRGSMCVSQI